MHSTMEQIAIWNDDARSIFSVPRNFEIFHCMVGRPFDQVWGTTLPLYLFKDFSYRPEIWWDDAQYDEADLYAKWPCSVNICTFHGTLKFEE